MKNSFRILLGFICLCLFSVQAFANEGGKVESSSASLFEETVPSVAPVKTGGQLKEREKTINDINTFLIESYKMKIDKILVELNTSLSQATRNNPDAQVKLLKKIHGDITAKEDMLESKSISQNRKKILSTIFAYIKGNINEKIQKISTERAEK